MNLNQVSDLTDSSVCFLCSHLTFALTVRGFYPLLIQILWRKGAGSYAPKRPGSYALENTHKMGFCTTRGSACFGEGPRVPGGRIWPKMAGPSGGEKCTFLVKKCAKIAFLRGSGPRKCAKMCIFGTFLKFRMAHTPPKKWG